MLRQPLPTAQEFYQNWLYAKRLKPSFVFDFDGTLVGFHSDPAQVKLTPSTERSLQILTREFPGQVMLLSGRSMQDLSRFSRSIDNLWLTGEHGADSNFMELVLHRKDLEYLEESAKPYQYLNSLTRLFPASFIERKRFSTVFHYRRAQGEVSNALAEEWSRELNVLLEPTALKCHVYNKVLEIKHDDCSKKNYVTQLRASFGPNTPLICFGDDTPEQELFDILSPQDISIAVGEKIQRSTYQTATPTTLSTWLEQLTSLL